MRTKSPQSVVVVVHEDSRLNKYRGHRMSMTKSPQSVILVVHEDFTDSLIIVDIECL